MHGIQTALLRLEPWAVFAADKPAPAAFAVSASRLIQQRDKFETVFCGYQQSLSCNAVGEKGLTLICFFSAWGR
jgi:hypothetical protein